MLAAIALASVCAATLFGQAVGASTTGSAPGARFYSFTGHTLNGPFLSFFDNHGGVKMIGYPLSEVVTENGRLVQYFERQRLEYHQEAAGTPYDVQLSRLGVELGVGRVSFAPAAPFAPRADQVYIPQTRHSLKSPFLGYWTNNGGVQLFGYPISEAVYLNGYLVQYFERARMEYHPEKARSGYGIELGLLGREYLDAHRDIAAKVSAVKPYAQAQTSAASAAPSVPKETVLMGLINRARTQAGMQAVRIDPSVSGVSVYRTHDMASRGYFSHVTPEGKDFTAFLGGAGIQYKATGEIIAYNNFGDDQTAAQAFAQFMNSPAHKAIIMDPKYNIAGVGETKNGKGNHFFDVIFVQK